MPWGNLVSKGSRRRPRLRGLPWGLCIFHISIYCPLEVALRKTSYSKRPWEIAVRTRAFLSPAHCFQVKAVHFVWGNETVKFEQQEPKVLPSYKHLQGCWCKVNQSEDLKKFSSRNFVMLLILVVTCGDWYCGRVYELDLSALQGVKMEGPIPKSPTLHPPQKA